MTIDFDGVYGYTTLFLEESFGGLVRKGFDPNKILRMEFISNRDETIIKKVVEYIF